MNLYGLLPDDLASHLRAHGVAIRDAEARRVLGRHHGYPVTQPVPRAVEQAVRQLTTNDAPQIVERATDPSDGFVKYLFRLHACALAEAVRIPLEKAGKFTVCLSSQAGCAMGCDFCATG